MLVGAGFGGIAAAPIARQVLEAALRADLSATAVRRAARNHTASDADDRVAGGQRAAGDQRATPMRRRRAERVGRVRRPGATMA
jgi:hypothetical protein